ncbi:porin [Burkholderia ubonensis]|uniref:porin n=1 Tax=Burkholderia ubonensis TaxID=101571 RepID=UPI000BA688F0|nr:porin [Burkholderia ubonensis]PAK11340.1 porin [Burkholderia ubonensis]RQP32281.1 porin [Burkholderia ubonensis]RQP34795.1 porin [Burkholderia ubonensis]RQP37922.1 porin [Burkholderia ubonensis]RQP49737.1 porin [Burkholderia ubonensis]
MKKITLALCVAGCLGTAAHAQGTVTLYGIVDAGLGYASNQRVATSKGSLGAPVAYRGASSYSFASGTWSGSRWGLKGKEDLGDGLAAVFQLESGFNIGTGQLGQGGRMFGRQSWMGLSSTRFGTLTMGRQYDPVVDFVGSIGPGSFLTGMGAHPGDLDNIDNQSRESNSVKYVSPKFGGFTLGALYGFGNQAGSVKNQNTWSVGGQYVNGPFAIGAAYLYATNAFGANGGAWTGSYDGTFASSINEGFASSKSMQIVAAASTYQIGAVTLGLSYSNTQYQAGAVSTFKGKATYNSVGGTVSWQASPALRVAAGYDFTRGSSVGGEAAPKYHQLNLASYYSLSKRTALYGLVGYQKANGKTLDAFGNVVNATASVGDVGNGISSAGDTQTLVRVGVRHTF